MYIVLSLLLFPHIGKSIEPDGKKVGESGTVAMKVCGTVGEDHINRFINMWEHFTKNLKTRSDAIAALSPYVDSKREEIYLTLLQMLLEGMPDELNEINNFMRQGNGHYDVMFQDLRIHIREEERVREEAAAADAESETSTPVAVGNPSFWGAEGADNLSTSNSIFKEATDKPPPIEDVHTIPQDIVVDVDTHIVPTQDDVVVDLEVDHEHAHDLALHNKMKLHVQHRKEADHEKDSSVREKAGGNKLARRVTTRQSSKKTY
jgi:hypothetical protein